MQQRFNRPMFGTAPAPILEQRNTTCPTCNENPCICGQISEFIEKVCAMRAEQVTAAMDKIGDLLMMADAKRHVAECAAKFEGMLL